MVIKTLLLGGGCVIFIIGMILFPLPVPLGIPTMLLGLAIMFKASNRIKRKVLWYCNKNAYSRNIFLKVKAYRLEKKRMGIHKS